MKNIIQILLGITVIGLATYSLISPEYDYILLPIMNLVMALLLAVIGLSVMKDNHKNVGILLLITSGLLFVVASAKLILE
ncbi:hypothetical protein MHH33_09105 [Paenisporosarcina sp. FSL H8-0542]|uniref:hypothetical protein n=1 Tax=Paenisporosarcina sp. FSL H8-0542 TaxID=2921401 RepID=UPI00315A2C93